MNNEITNLILQAEAIAPKNWLHALHLLESANSRYPDEPKIMYALAEFYTHKQMHEQAIKTLKKLIKLDNMNDRAHLLIAHNYYMSFEYEKALSHYDKILVSNRDIAYNKALCLAYTGRHLESIMAIKECLLDADNNPFIYFLLIEQLIRTNDNAEAEKYLRICEAKVGKHKHLSLLSALLYSKMGIWLKAYNSFYQYSQMAELSNYDHVHAFAICAWKIGRLQEALQLLEKAVVMAPYITEFHEDLVKLYVQMGKYDAAITAIDRSDKQLSRISQNLILMRERIHRERNKTNR